MHGRKGRVLPDIPLLGLVTVTLERSDWTVHVLHFECMLFFADTYGHAEPPCLQGRTGSLEALTSQHAYVGVWGGGWMRWVSC